MPTLQEQLDRFETRLEECRRAFLEDGTITRDEQRQLDRLNARIRDLRQSVEEEDTPAAAEGRTAAPEPASRPPRAEGRSKGGSKEAGEARESGGDQEGPRGAEAEGGGDGPAAASDDDQRRAAIEEAQQRCVDLQDDIDHLEETHPDESGHVRTELERGGYYGELSQIAAELNDLVGSGDAVPPRITSRLDEISRELRRLLDYREPRGEEPAAPAEPPAADAPDAAPAPAAEAEPITHFPDCCRRVLSVIPTQVTALQAAGHVANEIAPIITRAATVEDMIVAEAVRMATLSAADVIRNEGFEEAMAALPQRQRCRQIMNHLVLHESRAMRHPEERPLVDYWRQMARMWGCG